MKNKFKTSLSKLLLGLSLTVATTTSLTAQQNFIYSHSFQTSQFNVNQYNPPPQTWYPPSSTYGFQNQNNQNYNHPIASSSQSSIESLRKQQVQAAFLNNEYFSTFNSRLARTSGASHQQMMSNRDALVQRGNKILADLVSSMNSSPGIQKKTYEYQIETLSSTIASLVNEYKVLESELIQKQQVQADFFKHEYFHTYNSRLAEISGASLEQMMSSRDALVQQGNQILAKLVPAMLSASGNERKTYEYQIESLSNTIASLVNEYKAFEAELEQSRIEEEYYTNSQYSPENILDVEIDSPLIAQDLNNFNAIFTCDQAPDMAAFDNLMSAFLGKDDSSTSSNSDTSLPPDAFGEYVLTTFQYRDDNADVSMDIGRLIKVNDYDNSDTPLSLKNIHLSEDNQEVTFAFYSDSEKVLLKTDVPSMENFVAQKTIENYVYLEPSFPETQQYTFDFTTKTLPFSNVENVSPTFTQKILSFLADIAPVLGTVKGASELYYGIDPITGQKVSRLVTGFALAGSLVPLPGTKVAGKFVGLAAKKLIPGIKNIWASSKHVGSVENALLHFQRHRNEFPEIQNAKQYVEKAINFIKNPPIGTLTKIRSNGDKILYDPQNNIFVVVSKSGSPKTIFKPDQAKHGYNTNLDYFNAQR